MKKFNGIGKDIDDVASCGCWLLMVVLVGKWWFLVTVKVSAMVSIPRCVVLMLVFILLTLVIWFS